VNRAEVIRFLQTFFAGLEKAEAEKKTPQAAELKPFFDLVSSLRRDIPLAIPLLRDLANPNAGVLCRRIERRYLRLRRVQEELGRLDFKQAAPGASPEDYIFSRIDFDRYRKMSEKDFDALFPEGLTDFDETVLQKNFGLGRNGIKSLIESSYVKKENFYAILRENPLVISIMRALDSSLECSPLFAPEEIQGELEKLLEFLNAQKYPVKNDAYRLFPLLVQSLDNVTITHGDGMETKLFISPNGDLSGTFRPGNKPWTITLIRNSECGIN